MHPIVSFIIGFAIIVLASILNAAGLNLTKLDHVRVSAVPKDARPKDWMRPLWLLGMILYILSQLLGSTLALEYMRAEYVAPLGSSSLIFNFLFARFLVGTPVTNTDIYGTVVVILGVIGIVAFGSINSGLATESDVAHITYLWRRGGWLTFFFAMSGALFLLILFTSRLDVVLTARADLAAVPFSGNRQGGASLQPPNSASRRRDAKWYTPISTFFRKVFFLWHATIDFITDCLESWCSAKDDTQIAWTLGIGWACCGGGLAGLCLVFAKAVVKLLSGSLSNENPGNQFGHAAPIFTIILLAVTAVLQIVCLNKGLKVYDSTLVVPVFYGLYTATGFLDSLIFNNEVNSYKSWVLFLIFVSMIVLISGVVLLTHKKPEPHTNKIKSAAPASRRRRGINGSSNGAPKTPDAENGEAFSMRGASSSGAGEREGDNEADVLWAVGNADEDEDLDEGDEDIDHHQHPLNKGLPSGRVTSLSAPSLAGKQIQRRNSSSKLGNSRVFAETAPLVRVSPPVIVEDRRRSMDPFRDDQDEEDAEHAGLR